MQEQDIQMMANQNGINLFGKTKSDLIREIQRSEGNFDCFGTAASDCDQMECCFRSLCLNEVEAINRKQRQISSETTLPVFYNIKYLWAGMLFEK